MRSKRRSTSPVLVGAALGLAALPAHDALGQNCPQTSPASTWSGNLLGTTLTRNGVRFDDVQQRLQLGRGAGVFRKADLGINDDSVFVAAADFNLDGWTDFVGGGETSAWVRVYANKTGDHPTTNWADPTWVRTPDFQMARELVAPAAVNQRRPLVAGDFDGDGWPDIVRIVAERDEHPFEVRLWRNTAINGTFGYPQFAAAYDAMASGSYPADMGILNWTGRNAIAVDYNGDRKLDLLVGSSSDNGTIRVFLNDCTLQSPLPTPLPAAPAPLPCATAPHFVTSGSLITGLDFGSTAGALPVFDYLDFDGDGWRDLVVGSPNCCSTASQRLRIWKGVDGGGLEPTSSQSVTFAGGASSVLAADFSLDGRADLMVGTDNSYFGSSQGGSSYYYINNGSGTPFTAPFAQQPTSHATPSLDFDGAIAFDYDHDPDQSLDVMFADGNQSTNFYIMANRTNGEFVSCGEVSSGTVNLGNLTDDEMVVTGARLRATAQLNSGTLEYYLSNETPASWVLATPCTDASGDFCAGFPRSSGRDVRWKAVMCSDATRTQSPTLTSVQVRYDYTLAREHYRAGVVTIDGVAYVGAFRQPGDRGHFYAINAALDQRYWDVADKLDDGTVTDAERNIFTTNAAGDALVRFETPATPELTSALAAAGDAQTEAVVTWVRSPRFGVGNNTIERSKLGAVETSTAAVLGPPGLPVWYAFASADDRSRIDSFLASNVDRDPLVLFGSKDGMIHAIRSQPRGGNLTQAPNGEEAWAFIPRTVASSMVGDYTASLGGTVRVSAFPDGSPTLTDYKRSDGTFGTVALISGGNGGQSMVALDVTDSLGPGPGVRGPTPLWTATPGQSLAGQGLSKPAVARSRIGGVDRFVVVAATGPAIDDPTEPYDKGRIVAGYNLATGELLWRFQAQCPITSDLSMFETDDDLETGAPIIDGYIDRVVFADKCGYVYKVNPARDLDGGWNGNTGLGAISVGSADGVAMFALFSTAGTTNALGSQSPIGGTIAARPDDDGRVVLYFGTGGMDSHPAGLPNEFYGAFADSGAVKSKISGTCQDGVCEKFYGGVVVTDQQVIFTRTLDPQIGTTTCDPGRTIVQAIQIALNGLDEIVDDFQVVINSAVTGALYGDRGAVYFATLGGDVARVGAPTAANAGDASAGSPGPRTGPSDGGGTGGGAFFDPVILIGWRQIL